MNDAFELLDPINAREFLKHFSPSMRQQGDRLMRQGKVMDLTAQEPGLVYDATVEDRGKHLVLLRYDPVEGWSSRCTCESDNCGHVYAAMRGLLAEHSAAAVRNLSSGASTAARAKSAAVEPRESGGLIRRLMVAHNRPLLPEETKWIQKVRTVYKRCQQTRHITGWDFQEL